MPRTALPLDTVAGPPQPWQGTGRATEIPPTTLCRKRLEQEGVLVATTIVIRPLDKRETTGDSNSNGT